MFLKGHYAHMKKSNFLRVHFGAKYVHKVAQIFFMLFLPNFYIFYQGKVDMVLLLCHIHQILEVFPFFKTNLNIWAKIVHFLSPITVCPDWQI